jgi:hypothetical protein
MTTILISLLTNFVETPKMTWRELKEILNNSSEDCLDSNVTIFSERKGDYCLSTSVRTAKSYDLDVTKGLVNHNTIFLVIRG